LAAGLEGYASLVRPPRLLVLLALLGGLLAIGAPATADDGDSPRVVRVGTEGVYPPFSYRDPDTNELTGFDIDVMKAIGEKAGWDLQFVEAPFDSLFPALDSDRIDVIANQVTITGEREARYLFSTPYTYSHGVIVTAKDTDDITSLEDLKGRTTASRSSSRPGTSWSRSAPTTGRLPTTPRPGPRW
jgi:cystine transport system permease protein